MHLSVSVDQEQAVAGVNGGVVKLRGPCSVAACPAAGLQ
jgi:hypothetical protein